MQYYGTGDSYLIDCILAESELENVQHAESLFEELNNEIHFRVLLHRGSELPRLVCLQGLVAEEDEITTIPVYRHPLDVTPPLIGFTPLVNKIRLLLEEQLVQRGVTTSFNHCLIQQYRSGSDYIKEHCDKTLDISHDSLIVNYTVGASRTMLLRRKKIQTQPEEGGGEEERAAGCGSDRDAQRIKLSHNSLFVLGPG